MATGRIGVTPTLGTRWSKAPAGGTTSLSGLDDNSVSLVYSVGYEQVYRNGVLLSRGNDYTATTGNSITLIDATIAGDIIEVFANELVPLTDAISKGQFTAKGALLSATAASTPGVLTVGSNNQVLTADSSTSTGLKWAAIPVAAKSWTLLNAGGTALTGAQTITVSGISGKEDIMVVISGASSASASSFIYVRPNGISASYVYAGHYLEWSGTYGAANFNGTADTSGTGILIAKMSTTAANALSGATTISGCSSTGNKAFVSVGSGDGGSGHSSVSLNGFIPASAAITSIDVYSSVGNFDAGTVYVYGA